MTTNDVIMGSNRVSQASGTSQADSASSSGEGSLISSRSGSVELPSSYGTPAVSTLSLNESGDGDVSTMAYSEEGGGFTDSRSESGGGIKTHESPYATTNSLNEEGGGLRTHESPITTMAYGEEGGGIETHMGPILTHENPVETHKAPDGTSYQDYSAEVEILKLITKINNGETITAEEMYLAIKNGISDLDAHGASLENVDFNTFFGRYSDHLSDGAKKVMEIYNIYAEKHAYSGGITESEANTMFEEMSQISDPVATTAGLNEEGGGVETHTPPLTHEAPDGTTVYQDDTAKAEILKLITKINNGETITADEMYLAIKNGISDLDGKGASTEFSDFNKFYWEYQDHLSTGAKDVMKIYGAKAAEHEFTGGIPIGELDTMLEEMDKVDDAYILLKTD
ncbi:MAG: hypothetical protein PHV30_02435 [Candidatus Margulisbacteria bacterium]|nr:hypothetical protein [Candidatus Margulisiibacteriota bacterium]